MIAPYSRYAVLKQQAVANGTTPTNFNEVCHGCLDTANLELQDATEEAQNYMAELWTRSLLCKLNAEHLKPQYIVDFLEFR